MKDEKDVQTTKFTKLTLQRENKQKIIPEGKRQEQGQYILLIKVPKYPPSTSK